MEVRIFLCHVRFYSRFIDDFTKIDAPLFKFLTKDVKFPWNKYCQDAFKGINEKITMDPMLKEPC